MINISVIIPINNAQNSILKTVKSILNTATVNLELILVENNSSDKSLDVCYDIQKQNPGENIIVIKSEETSAGGALNDGLEVAQGQFIHFVDADDEVYAYVYENLIKDLNNKQADVIQGRYVVYDYTLKKYVKIMGNQLSYNNSYWNKLYRHDFIKEHNIRFIPNVLSQDGNFNADIKLNYAKIIYIEELIYKYYINVDSVSDSVRIKTINGFYYEGYKENKLLEYGKFNLDHRRNHQFYRFFAFDYQAEDFDEAFDKFSKLAIDYFMNVPLKNNILKINKSYSYVMYVALYNKDKEAVKILQKNHKEFLNSIGTPNQREYLAIINKETKEINKAREKEIIKNLKEVKNNKVQEILKNILIALITNNKEYGKYKKRVLLFLIDKNINLLGVIL